MPNIVCDTISCELTANFMKLRLKEQELSEEKYQEFDGFGKTPAVHSNYCY